MVGSALRQRAADMEQWRQQKRGRAS